MTYYFRSQPMKGQETWPLQKRLGRTRLNYSGSGRVLICYDLSVRYLNKMYEMFFSSQEPFLGQSSSVIWYVCFSVCAKKTLYKSASQKTLKNEITTKIKFRGWKYNQNAIVKNTKAQNHPPSTLNFQKITRNNR